MGAEVVAISTSERKKEDAIKMGASEFIATDKGKDGRRVWVNNLLLPVGGSALLYFLYPQHSLYLFLPSSNFQNLQW
jgi:D-arabinose 1-dehydrogenase-like Zn-dependent alcohol dehydrogenase